MCSTGVSMPEPSCCRGKQCGEIEWNVWSVPAGVKQRSGSWMCAHSGLCLVVRCLRGHRWQTLKSWQAVTCKGGSWCVVWAIKRAFWGWGVGPATRWPTQDNVGLVQFGGAWGCCGEGGVCRICGGTSAYVGLVVMLAASSSSREHRAQTTLLVAAQLWLGTALRDLTS